MSDKTINDEMIKPEKEDKEELMKDKNKTQKEVKSQRRREIEIMRFTIILSVGIGIIGNFLVSTTFRLVDNPTYWNVFMLLLSGGILIMLGKGLGIMINKEIDEIEEMVKN